MRRALVLLLLSTAPAAAFQPTGSVVADAFLATLEDGGYTDVAAGGVTRGDGGSVTLANVTAKAAQEVGQTLSIDAVTIDNGVVNAANELVADKIVYDGVTVAETDTDLASTIGNVTISGARFAGAGDPAAGVSSLLGSFDTVALSDISAVSPEGGTVTVRDMTATVRERDLDEAAAGDFAVHGLSFDVSVWDEPAAQQMRALGYDTLTMDLIGSGRWEAATGRATLDEAKVAVDDLGTLSLAAALDGLTAETLTTLQASVEDFNALLGLMQNVTVGNLTVSYEDAGLTARVLADTAKRSGITEDILKQSVLGTIPAALAVLNNPTFTAEVTDAAKTFLAAPGTLTVRAAPASPVTMAQVFGAAMMSPQMLPDLLNIEITAAK